ncbi:lysophospholipid acyltransferase family protein [Chlorobium sp.]|uniref:lysophospholipid acyltransferase family protein n=1 Tax=Chlorobium sp. TaxID=1095 RepID=UPI0025C2AFCE|nr:lysophospholipid acyltransferase family protein [Chlorobium sp.]
MQTLFRSLPCLTFKEALILRLLMVPNMFLIRATGMENLARSGPAIYVFNHNNSIESLLVPVYLMFCLGGKRVSFVIDWMFGKIPVLGWLMEMIDPLYVYHKRSTIPLIESRRPVQPAADTIERCCAKLDEGGSIGIFPEGRRNRDPERLARAKPGVGHIILRSGVPVVPVGIDFPLRQRKGKIPMIGRMILRAGTPLEFPALSDRYRLLDASAGQSRARHALASEVTAMVMRQLSLLCGKSCVEPLPVFDSAGHSTTIYNKELPCQV